MVPEQHSGQLGTLYSKGIPFVGPPVHMTSGRVIKGDQGAWGHTDFLLILNSPAFFTFPPPAVLVQLTSYLIPHLWQIHLLPVVQSPVIHQLLITQSISASNYF